MDTIHMKRGSTQMVAHRGLSGLEKENTMGAFIAAGNRSYFGIETDLHRTADGKFIIVHDDTLTRLAGLPHRIEETDFDTLRSIELLDTEGLPGRVDLRMPTLREYLSVCKKYEKTAVLELKNQFSEEDIGRVISELRELDSLSHVIFISFFADNLKYVRKYLPEQPVQFLTKQMSDAVWELLKTERFDLDIHHSALSRELINELHALGLLVNCWTVNDPAAAAELLKWGVDFITTNILE